MPMTSTLTPTRRAAHAAGLLGALLVVLAWVYWPTITTLSSTYLLQTLGVPALSRGNVIVIDEQEVGVAEACSGLGMLMTFFALSTAVALVLRRPWPDRLAIFLSAIPIGVLMNVLRIT